jgi:hypothetical protein
VDNFGLFDQLRFVENIEQPEGLHSSLGKRKRSAPKGAPAYGGYAAPKKALRRLAPRKSAAQKGMQKRKGAGNSKNRLSWAFYNFRTLHRIRDRKTSQAADFEGVGGTCGSLSLRRWKRQGRGIICFRCYVRGT